MSKTNPSMMRSAIARRLAACVIGAAALGACASSGASSSAGGASAQHTSRDMISAEELANVKADNLYDAIQKLRPEFLRGDQVGIVGQTDASGARVSGSIPAGASTSVGPVADPVVPVTVYRNSVRLGALDDLRQIMISDVKEVRYLKGPQAVIRLGTGNSSGAILITTYR